MYLNIYGKSVSGSCAYCPVIGHFSSVSMAHVLMLIEICGGGVAHQVSRNIINQQNKRVMCFMIPKG
jgi:uncharacterized Zn-finger protein